VAIARALIKNAPIILPRRGHRGVGFGIRTPGTRSDGHLCKGKTTLAIAHRLHTISHGDRIYVVEDGRAVESGRHDELCARTAAMRRSTAP